jgi:uncharacterized repeat protein (TIGR01451 family)
MKAVQIFSLLVLALGVQAVAGIAQAQQNPVVLKSIAESEIEVKNAQGAVEKKRVPLQKALPGAEVIYTTSFANQGSKPVGNIVITNPVPANTIYVGSSAFGDKAAITFSVNGGKTYGTPDSLIVIAGDGRERPALPSDYTHIRWVLKGDLPAGGGGAAGFRVQVK